MRILIACIHYPVAGGRFIQRAFKRLGHDVRTVGPTTGNRIWEMDIDPRWAWTPDITLDEAGNVVAIREDMPDDWQPDPFQRAELCITADSAYTLTGQTGGLHILWGMDNHVRDYTGLREWDAMFLAHSWGARIDESNAHWLPPAYDPDVHVNLGRERDIDVALLGFPYPERIQLARAFSESGLRCHFSLGALWDDYRDLYNRVRVALNWSIANDVTQRILETMAMGCAVLTNRCPDLDKMGFVEGAHYAGYETTEHAVAQARQLLESGRWRELAAAGERAVKPHTWDARAQTVLETVKEMAIRRLNEQLPAWYEQLTRKEP